MSTGGTIWLILKKDLLVELRSREVIASMGLFALLVMVIFAFAFNLSEARARLIGAGILWVTILFAGTLGLYRVFDRERDHGCLTGLLRAPAGPMAVYTAKVLGLFAFVLIVEVVTVPLMLAFMGMSIDTGGLPLFFGTLVLGTLGFCLVGVLFGGLLSSARLREVLVPMVLYPVVVPVLVGGVKLTGIAWGSGLAQETGDWLRLMGGFCLVFLAVCPWVFARSMVD